MNKCTLVCAITTMIILVCACKREKREGEAEERNDGKKKSFIVGLGKWNRSNAYKVRTRGERNSSRQNSLTFNNVVVNE